MKTFKDKKLARIQLLTQICDMYADLAYEALQAGSMEEYDWFRNLLLAQLPELNRITNCGHKYPYINV